MKTLALAGSLLSFAILTQAGCDKISGSLEDAKKAVSGAAEQATENVVEQTKQMTGDAGRIELSLDQPLSANGCYATIYPGSSIRPAVLQITSYNDPSAESFPSVFLRAELQTDALAQLQGQKLAARCFVQSSPEGDVWQSPDDTPIELTITAVAGDVIDGQVQGTLVNCSKGNQQPVSGTLKGVAKPPK